MSQWERKEYYDSISILPNDKLQSYPKNLFHHEDDRFPTEQKFKQRKYENFNPPTRYQSHRPDHLTPTKIQQLFNNPEKLLTEINTLVSSSNQLNRLQYTFILLEKEQPLPATTKQLISKIMEMFCEVLKRLSQAKEPKEDIPELSRRFGNNFK